jgi:hypothetical protein
MPLNSNTVLRDDDEIHFSRARLRVGNDVWRIQNITRIRRLHSDQRKKPAVFGSHQVWLLICAGLCGLVAIGCLIAGLLVPAPTGAGPDERGLLRMSLSAGGLAVVFTCLVIYPFIGTGRGPQYWGVEVINNAGHSTELWFSEQSAPRDLYNDLMERLDALA